MDTFQKIWSEADSQLVLNLSQLVLNVAVARSNVGRENDPFFLVLVEEFSIGTGVEGILTTTQHTCLFV